MRQYFMHSKKILRVYQTKNQKEPFTKWLLSLRDVTARAKIRARLDNLMLGHYGDCKNISDGVKELRLHTCSGYRVYIGEIDDVIVLLLCGGNKSSQKKDIEKAKKYWHDFQERNL